MFFHEGKREHEGEKQNMIRDDDKFYAAVTQNGTWAEGRGV